MTAVPGILRRWNPGVLQGLTVWFDSSDRATIGSNSDTSVFSITDKTANNVTLTQGNSGLRPSVRPDIGGRNTVRFGTDRYLQTSNFPFGPTSNFINVNVFTGIGYTNTNYLYSLSNTNEFVEISYTNTNMSLNTRVLNNNNTIQFSISSSAIANNRHISQIIYNFNTNTIFTHINSTGTNASGNSSQRLNFQNSMSNFILGRTFRAGVVTPDNSAASMSEMVFYNMSNSTLEPLEGYLAWKWGLQSYLSATHPYKNRPPS